jgi:hypothetical protein
MHILKRANAMVTVYPFRHQHAGLQARPSGFVHVAHVPFQLLYLIASSAGQATQGRYVVVPYYLRGKAFRRKKCEHLSLLMDHVVVLRCCPASIRQQVDECKIASEKHELAK